MSELPQGWTSAPLSELCVFNPRHDSTLDRSLDVSFVPMAAVSDVTGEILEHETRSLGEVWKGYTHFQDGDVIFAKITPCMENGKIAVAEGLVNGIACGSTEFHVLRSRGGVDNRLLWYFLRQKSFRSDAELHMTGAVGQRRVPAQFLEDTDFPVAPLAEQRRIVEKLDSLFARTRHAREELERVSRLVEHYKQAILHKAFQGEMLGGRDQWKHKPLSAVASLQLGKMLDKAKNKGDFNPYLRNINVRWYGFDLTDVAEMRFTEDELEKYEIRKGDILVCEGGEPGRAAIWEGEDTGIKFQKAIHRVRVSDQVLPEWIVHQLAYLASAGRLESHFTGTTIKHLPQQALKRVELVIPPIAEQQVILTIINRMFQSINNLCTEANRALALLDHLEQSTLAKAFRGELLPQDANDEPASVLLDRIRGNVTSQQV